MTGPYNFSQIFMATMTCKNAAHRKNVQKILDNCVIGFILSTLRSVPARCKAHERAPHAVTAVHSLMPERETDDAFCPAATATGSPQHQPPPFSPSRSPGRRSSVRSVLGVGAGAHVTEI